MCKEIILKHVSATPSWFGTQNCYLFLTKTGHKTNLQNGILTITVSLCHFCLNIKDAMSSSFKQNCLHFTFEPQLSSLLSKYKKLQNIAIHANYNTTDKNAFAEKAWSTNMALFVLRFLCMTMKQFNSLTTINHFSYFGGREVTHQTVVPEVQGSIPRPNTDFNGVCCCSLFLV